MLKNGKVRGCINPAVSEFSFTVITRVFTYSASGSRFGICHNAGNDDSPPRRATTRATTQATTAAATQATTRAAQATTQEQVQTATQATAQTEAQGNSSNISNNQALQFQQFRGYCFRRTEMQEWRFGNNGTAA